MKKYHTWYDARIEEVEVVKETANYVTVVETWMGKQQEHRDAKRSDHGHNYFDTWAEAKAFLIDREKSTIVDLLQQIAKHEGMLREIEEMRA